jgi:putative colanic acid biosynthesis UDP-glucose lipid carrier transferase
LDARAGRVDIVYVALPLRAEARIRGLIESLADTTATVHVVADVLLSDLMQSRISSVGEVPVIDVFDHPFHGVNGTLKRIEDIVLGLMILGIIALPMAIIAAAIKLTSKGPVLFRQRRYGLNGEQITVLKFRTMTVSEDGPQVTQATKNDSRITPLGAFLRRTSLDELPQFFNVLGGHMSIVGPRPHAVAHNEQYRRLISGYMLRHKVKPGITGWAQVNGWRGETDTLEKMQKRIQHDLVYIRNWALFLDIQIIFLTVFGRAVRRNAY